MAIRTITFEATLDGISPKAPQNAGIQGEHNATTVVINLSPQLVTEINKPNTYYRFEFVDCMGQFDTTENFTLSSGASSVNIDIPNGWTSSGGNAELRLVIVRLNVDNNEEMILYSLPCKLKFEGRDTGTGLTPETVEKGLSGLIADAKTATESANSAASSAINAGDYAIVRADYADSVAVIVGLKGNYAKAQGDYAKLQGDYAKEKGDYASAAAADVNTAISNATPPPTQPVKPPIVLILPPLMRILLLIMRTRHTQKPAARRTTLIKLLTTLTKPLKRRDRRLKILRTWYLPVSPKLSLIPILLRRVKQINPTHIPRQRLMLLYQARLIKLQVKAYQQTITPTPTKQKLPTSPKIPMPNWR